MKAQLERCIQGHLYIMRTTLEDKLFFARGVNRRQSRQFHRCRSAVKLLTRMDVAASPLLEL